jgi:hypothetical protein
MTREYTVDLQKAVFFFKIYMNKEDVLRILEGFRKRMNKQHADIKPFKMIKSKTETLLYTDDIFTDESYENNENLYHVFARVYKDGTFKLINFRKYTEPGSIDPEQEMNMIFDIARIFKCKCVQLSDMASKKYNKKYYNITLFNLLSGKDPYYAKYGFKSDIKLPVIDKKSFMGYGKKLLPILIEYKKNKDMIFYSSFCNEYRKYRYSDARLLSLIMFCKAVIAYDVTKMTYLFDQNQQVIPKLVKSTKVLFKDNSFESLKKFYQADQTWTKVLD